MGEARREAEVADIGANPVAWRVLVLPFADTLGPGPREPAYQAYIRDIRPAFLNRGTAVAVGQAFTAASGTRDTSF